MPLSNPNREFYQIVHTDYALENQCDRFLAMLIALDRNKRKELTLGAISLKLEKQEFRLIELLKTQFAYGHREILLDYLNLDYSHLILGVVQHGCTATDEPWECKTPRAKGFFKRVPSILFAKSRADRLLKEGNTNVVAIGAPWLYMARSLPATKELTRERVLVFPNHSDLRVGKVSFSDIEKKIKRWKEIAEGLPISVCLYWSDFLDPDWKFLCEREGVNMLMSGVGGHQPPWLLHTSRTKYLETLRKHLQEHQFVIVETFTSALFYAAYEGKKIRWSPETLSESEKKLTGIVEGNDWMNFNFSRSNHGFQSPEVFEEKWRDMLGVDSQLSASDLRNLLPLRQGVVPSV